MWEDALPEYDFEEELQEEANVLWNSMCQQIKNKIKEIRKNPVSVLIWGPSPYSGSIIAKIRSQLRQVLRKEGHLAMFSEEICDPGSDVSIRSQELVQAEMFDLIIAIPDSPGSIAEVHDFTSDPRVNKKTLVFMNEKYASGYSAISLQAVSCKLGAEIIPYNEDSITFIINKSLTAVKEIQEYKYIIGGRF